MGKVKGCFISFSHEILTISVPSTVYSFSLKGTRCFFDSCRTTPIRLVMYIPSFWGKRYALPVYLRDGYWQKKKRMAIVLYTFFVSWMVETISIKISVVYNQPSALLNDVNVSSLYRMLFFCFLYYIYKDSHTEVHLPLHQCGHIFSNNAMQDNVHFPIQKLPALVPFHLNFFPSLCLFYLAANNKLVSASIFTEVLYGKRFHFMGRSYIYLPCPCLIFCKIVSSNY